MKLLTLISTSTVSISLVVSFFSVNITAFSNHASYHLNNNLNIPTRGSTVGFKGRRGGNDDVTTGYVPSGLTADQYAKIKKEELEKKKKMDFGAWGPRFAKSERPDGDWMVVPSLWTSGFDTRPQYSGRASSTNNTDPYGRQNGNIIMQNLIFGLKKYVSLYAFVLLLIEIFATTIHIINAEANLALAAVVRHQMNKRASKALSLVSFDMVVKLTCVKMIVAGSLMKPLSYLIEKLNRRLLWSPRRTMTFSTLASLSILSVSYLVKTVVTTGI